MRGVSIHRCCVWAASARSRCSLISRGDFVCFVFCGSWSQSARPSNFCERLKVTLSEQSSVNVVAELVLEFVK